MPATLPNRGLLGIILIWLTRPCFPTNFNAGEGVGNLTELKTFDEHTKPYVSSQSLRHALREAIERLYPGVFMCDTVAACGDVEKCWLCDLFGYFNASLKIRGRHSAIHTPGMWAQLRTEITTDLILRAPGKGNNTVAPALAHVQLNDNVYRAAMSIDIRNIGLTSISNYSKEANKTMPLFDSFEHYSITDEERKKRAIAIIHGLMTISDFAMRARGQSVADPRLFIAVAQPTYRQTLYEGLELDSKGKVDITKMRRMLRGQVLLGGKLFWGYQTGLVANESALIDLMAEFDLGDKLPEEGLLELAEEVDRATLVERENVVPFAEMKKRKKSGEKAV